jgi:hypothetical protein
MTQSAAEAPPTAEAIAEAAELAAEAAADAAELATPAAEEAAELAVEAAELALLELQAASIAQHPPTAITASARRGARARDNKVREGLVTVNT